MKNIFIFSIVLLLLCGVFGDDAGEEKKSVMEGDSVTLHTGLTDIQNVLKITWTIGEEGSRSVIVNLSVIDGRVAVDVDKRFRDRLQVNNQTGDVTITNMKIKHTGLYQAEIIEDKKKYKKFNITVNDVPRVSESEKCEVKSVSVMEGESVTLHTDVQTQKNDLIVWRFGPECILIAKDDKEDDKSSIDVEEIFRGRLKLDDQNGSLTITNTKTTDAGVYKLKISNNKQILHQTFSVYVRGAQFSVTVVITCVVLLSLSILVLLAIDVYQSHHKTTSLRQIIASCTSTGDKRRILVVFHFMIKALLLLLVVLMGFVTYSYIMTLDLNQIDDKSSTSLAVIFGVLQMMLFLTVIMVFQRISQQKQRGKCVGVLCLLLLVLLMLFVGIYTFGLVDLKQMEGHITKIYIIMLVLLCVGLIYNFSESFCVKLMKVQNMLVFEGESLILPTGVTELESDDVTELSFDNEVIAEFKKNIKISDDDERFTDRLQLNAQTGSLIIRNMRKEDAGLYKVKMSSSSKVKSILQFIISGGSSYCQFNVIIYDSESESVMVVPNKAENNQH